MQFNYEPVKNIHSFQQVSEPHFYDDRKILLCFSHGGNFSFKKICFPFAEACCLFSLPKQPTAA